MAIPPGLYYKGRAPEEAPDPLRSDVAGFIGRTRRGPLRDEQDPQRVAVVRSVGWRRYQLLFGDLVHEAALPYAARGFFDNGGQVAYFIRVGSGGAVAAACWNVSSEGAHLHTRASLWRQGTTWSATVPPNTSAAMLQPAFAFGSYRVEAATPGAWGNQVTVAASFERQGPDGQPRVQLVVRAPDEDAEFLSDLAPYRTDEDEAKGNGPTMANQVKAESNLIRLVPLTETATRTIPGSTAESNAPVAPPGFSWPLLTLEGGVEPQADLNAYLAAAERLGDVPEVALVALPDLYDDLSESDAAQVLRVLAEQAEAAQDRLVLVDVPPGKQAARCAIAYASSLRDALPTDGLRRAAAVYHPWLCVVDPFGPPGQPFRTVAPSGHVAGVIARNDRDRGPHHTPANVPIFEAVDVAATFGPDDAGQLNDAGVNLVRPRAALGLQVWGGRTLDQQPAGLYVAHRRLIHNLVRAIRRAAEPVVFQTNGPKLRLMLVRAVTSVLVQAFQAGALQGVRPEEGFAVRCDDQTNPPAAVENGLTVCEIDIAPAVPMEFITLRVAVSAAGQLEVFAP